MKEEIISLTDKLVRFRSTEENPQDIQRCADFIVEYFEEEDVHVRKYNNNGVPSVYISLKDTTEPEILLNAHFDVVPAGEEMFTPRMDGSLMKGRGVFDDKGPLAILMVLMKELSRLENKPDLALLTTGDEERGGHDGAKHMLGPAGITSDFAIVLDGGNLNRYSTKAKGILELKLTAEGLDAHGSRPWEGVNAVEKLMNLYMDIKELFKQHHPSGWERTINLGKLSGGDVPNKVPSEAEMLLDIRYTDMEDPEELLAKIKELTREAGNVEIDVLLNDAVFTSPEDNEYLKELLKTSQEVLEEEPVVAFDHGGSDARFFSLAGIPSVVTCPLGGNHHSKDEFLDIDHLEDFYEVLKRFALTYTLVEANPKP